MPFTRVQRRRTCYFIILPSEFFQIISTLLPLRDRLALADTCVFCRSLVSDKECQEACTKAGLSIPLGKRPRVMAKLLSQPRVGLCNWSGEGGIPKGTRFSNGNTGIYLNEGEIGQRNTISQEYGRRPEPFDALRRSTCIQQWLHSPTYFSATPNRQKTYGYASFLIDLTVIFCCSRTAFTCMNT